MKQINFYTRKASLLTFSDIGLPELMNGESQRKAEFLESRPSSSELNSPHTKMDKEGIRKARLELLAAMLWGKLGDQSAIVKETDPNELTIELGDLSWVVSIKDDGKISVSGFDSGVEQYIGKMPDKNSEISLIEIANNAIQLIQDDIEENEEPPQPPIHYGPEDDLEGTDEQLETDEDPVPSPETSQGDELQTPGGEVPLDQSMGQPPIDPSMGTGSEPMPPAGGTPGMPMPTGMPPDGGPPGMPMPPQGA
jgi:hypothetical protein